MTTYSLLTFVTSSWGPDDGVLVTNHVTSLYIYTTLNAYSYIQLILIHISMQFNFIGQPFFYYPVVCVKFTFVTHRKLALLRVQITYTLAFSFFNGTVICIYHKVLQC
jgi:hypothetical protein